MDTCVKLSLTHYVICENLGIAHNPIGIYTSIKQSTVTSYFHLFSITPLTSPFYGNVFQSILEQCSNDQNIPLSSFVLIQSSCVTLPWDPLKIYSFIIGQTCLHISQDDDPATLIGFYLPIQEYLPRQHVSNMSAYACKDIQEFVKTEYYGLVSNKYVQDLAFVLDVAFIDGKTNIVFLGMANVFLCCYEWCNKSSQLQSIAGL